MMLETLQAAVVAHGLSADEGRAVLAAARPIAAWLATCPLPPVASGLGRTADPVAALHGAEQLLAHAQETLSAAEIEALLVVLGGSPVLTAALIAEGQAWPTRLRAALATVEEDVAAHRSALADGGLVGAVERATLYTELRHYRRRAYLRIGARDLLGLASVDETVREISSLADGLIGTALDCTRARLSVEWRDAPRTPFVVFGMGKLGGGELNYSSDVDLVYLYERDETPAKGRTAREFFVRLAEEVTRALREVTADGFCFRVDLRLRPGGSEGALAVSLPVALSYFESWGQTWERAAWLKARPVAGDAELGRQLLEELAPFMYRRYLDYATLEDLEAMKRRVDASLRGPTARARDVKLGRGGIREIEFFVQAQQLVHAGKDARLRLRATLAGLTQLAACGYIETELAASLSAAYRFLRHVEHKIQIVHERQTQLIPEDPAARQALARRLGYVSAGAVDAFTQDYARHTDAVHAAFSALFRGAGEQRRAAAAPELTTLFEELEQEERALWRLGQLGFQDLEAAYQELRLLRDGPPHAPASPRRRRALAQLAPSLLREIAGSSNPDRALRSMATFITTVGARTSYLHLLLENPGVLRLLVRLFAGSEYLSNFFLRHPEVLDSLVRADLVRLERDAADLERELATRLAAASDLESVLDTLRRLRHEEFLRIGIHDIEGELEPPQVMAQLTVLAEVCLRAALSIARREVLARSNLPADSPTDGLCVLAMGTLGGADLNYNSDLDLIFVYDAGDPTWWEGRATAHEFFTRIAQRTISALQTPTREGVAYRIDTRLRPSGNQGSLVSSLAAFTAYHATEARLWERQALIRARVLAGPATLASRLQAVVDDCVYGRGLTPAEVAEIADMRERIARERTAASGVNIKTSRGGLVDVEFLVQMLQLRHGSTHPSVRCRSTVEALQALAAAGLLDPADAQILAEGYAFLRALENRLRLECDQPVEAIDSASPALVPLARRLGYGGSDDEAAATLQATYARHTTAIQAVYDRLFAAARA